jgi:hypothetical protein
VLAAVVALLSQELTAAQPLVGQAAMGHLPIRHGDRRHQLARTFLQRIGLQAAAAAAAQGWHLLLLAKAAAVQVETAELLTRSAQTAAPTQAAAVVAVVISTLKQTVETAAQESSLFAISDPK